MNSRNPAELRERGSAGVASFGPSLAAGGGTGENGAFIRAKHHVVQGNAEGGAGDDYEHSAGRLR